MPQVLEGITILDFTRGMPGAIATMVGSDFGAEVIKVEPPGGDPFRSMPGALQWDRGKRSVVLDLKSRRGQAQAQALTRRADVVIESLRPGVTQRLGIDYDTLRALKPDLVYCSITGFGSKGAYAGYKGYEGVVAAKCGRMAAFGGRWTARVRCSARCRWPVTRRPWPHFAAWWRRCTCATGRGRDSA
jgi:crotonobetainyl-CoA:carnitine CoA-transferase CaiB-like acyl-CoA transferase